MLTNLPLLTPFICALFLLFPCLLAIVYWIDPDLLDQYRNDRSMQVIFGLVLAFGSVILAVG